MEISEILGLDEYFRDPRFAARKPNLHGSWKERRADNFYSRSLDGTWFQHPTRFHIDERVKKQDTKHARVFIGERFWYRGRSAAAAPEKYAPLIGGRGARVNHDPALVIDFCAWVAGEFEPGVGDVPNDNPDMDCKVEAGVRDCRGEVVDNGLNRLRSCTEL
jgi:Nucleotide modification associated domain 2